MATDDEDEEINRIRSICDHEFTITFNGVIYCPSCESYGIGD